MSLTPRRIPRRQGDQIQTRSLARGLVALPRYADYGRKEYLLRTSDRSDMGSGLFSVPTLEQQIESLRPGDHVCVIRRGESLTVASELSQAGIDVEQAREQGALTLLTSRQFMPLEKLDPSAFIALFSTRAQQALNAGFYGASFVVEMIWTVELDVAHDAVMEVETRLNSEFFPSSPALAICIYEPQRLSAEYLLGALESHPLAVVDDKLISDPFYEPPELIAQPSDAARVDWMITQLVRWTADREELRRSHDRFRALIATASY